MIVAVPRESHPGERRVALVPASSPPAGQGRDGGARRGRGRPVGRLSRPTICRQGGQDRPVARRRLSPPTSCSRSGPPGPTPRPAAPTWNFTATGQVVIGLCDPLGSPKLAAEMAAKGVSLFALEIASPHHPGAEHGRALVAGHDRRLSGGAAGGRSLAQDFPHDDYGRRHAQRREGLCDRGGRGRLAGHRHGPPLGRGRVGLRRSPGRQGAGAEPRRQVCRDGTWTPRPPRPRAATPRRWARSSTASSGN